MNFFNQKPKKLKLKARNSLDAAIEILGRTEWYTAIHGYRFLRILQWSTYYVNSGSACLEVGVWPGYLALAHQKAGFEVSGIDLDPSRLNNNITEAIQITKLDLNQESLPFPNNSFDLITFSEVIEHLELSRKLFILGEFKRILRPGGYLIITTPNKFRLRNILFGKKVGKVIDGHGHEYEYGFKELSQVILESGFKIEEGGMVSFYAGVGKEKENEYFYPLINFYKRRSKIKNFLKLLIYLILKFVPLFRDSMFFVLKKSL